MGAPFGYLADRLASDAENIGPEAVSDPRLAGLDPILHTNGRQRTKGSIVAWGAALVSRCVP